MFYVWWDDLMEISGFCRTAELRLYFVSIYGHNAWRSWIGLDRENN